MITYKTTTKKGFGRGKTLGFPTINMEIPDVLLQEQRGIYAAKVTIGGVQCDAALYFGPPITFGVTTEQLEVYLLDATHFEHMILGESIECTHYAFIRPVATFPDSESLVMQMHQDIERVRDELREVPRE